MMKKINYIILLLLFLTSCSNFSQSTQSKTAHRVTNRVIKTLETKYNMTCISLTEGGGKPGYNFIGLGFIKKGIIDKDTGRKMIIDCTYELLNEINSDAKLQEFLLVRPFTGENIDISIHIVKENGDRVYYPNVIFFSAYKGKIHFDTKSPEMEFGYKTEESETFEEAVKIVESQTEYT